MVSGKVRYSKREDKLLALPVPMEMATNKSGWGLPCALAHVSPLPSAV